MIFSKSSPHPTHPHHLRTSRVTDAAGLLGWWRAEMNAAIRNGAIEVVETCSGKRIELRELAAYALQQWPRESRD